MKAPYNIFYALILAIAFGAKATFASLENDTLLFILKPISIIISLVTDLDYSYTNEFGIYFETLNITIDKSCSGINFWLISFVVFSFALLNKYRALRKKKMLIPITFIGTYFITLFANTSRILTSIVIEKQADFDFPWLHQAEGVFIYLSILILVYSSINRDIFKLKIPNEKLT